ncbi:hypothetical protein C0581_03090 [Candidatus Parcubacteria bacterium]|nr:MAG: hypothetical protein C0581_03090 [Candidatus Parcubacteria bacterium]
MVRGDLAGMVVMSIRRTERGSYHIIASTLYRDKAFSTLKSGLKGLPQSAISECLEIFKLSDLQESEGALQSLRRVLGEDANIHLPQGPLFWG